MRDDDMALEFSDAEKPVADVLETIFYAQPKHTKECDESHKSSKDKCEGCVIEREALEKLKVLDMNWYNEMKSELYPNI